MTCIFCGGCDRMQKRGYPLKDIQDFMNEYAKPSQFHYESIMKLDNSKVMYQQCLFCANWKRQVIRHKTCRTSRTVTYTPIDHMILYTMEPGAVQEPDHRCISRVLNSCISPRNPFWSLIPYQCRVIMGECKDFSGEEVPEKLVIAWHKYNAKTPFFRSKATARMVRRAYRQVQVYADIPHIKRIRWRH
jgi:hypothetical protein